MPLDYQQKRIEKLYKDKQKRIEKRILLKDKQIAFFNSVNAAISLLKDYTGKNLKKKIIKWRNWFYEQWQEWYFENLPEPELSEEEKRQRKEWQIEGEQTIEYLDQRDELKKAEAEADYVIEQKYIK